MNEKIKTFTINAVKILAFILVWMLLFHACSKPSAYERGYEAGYEDGQRDG